MASEFAMNGIEADNIAYVFQEQASDYINLIPDQNIEQAKDINIEEKKVTISVRNNTWEVFYREAKPQASPTHRRLRKSRNLEDMFSEECKPPVILLHGINWSSWTWEDNGTMQILATLGHRIIALDLPGDSNETQGIPVPSIQKGEFLARFIYRTLSNTSLPIVVCPSTTEPYVLPYLLNIPRKADPRVGAAILVSPGWPLSLKSTITQTTSIPTLIIFDEESKIWEKSKERITSAFTQGRYLRVKGGSRLYYPAQWHAKTTLFNFLKMI